MQPVSNLMSLEDKNDVRDKFLSALIKLMAQKPYIEISITEICKQSNLSRRTFYNHFDQKTDLLNHLAEDLVLGFHITDDHSGFLHIFEYWYELRDIVSLLIENNLWDFITSKIAEQYIPLLQQRNWEDYLDTYIDDKNYYFAFIDAGISKLIFLWYKDNFKKTPAELAGLVEQIIN